MGKQAFDDWLAGGEVPIARLIGFELVEKIADRAVIEFVAGPQHANPMGTLHGGVLCDISDAAMGTAWATGLKDSESFTTIELKINFFRPVLKGKLRAEARVLRRGRKLGYIECDIYDTERRPVARAACTCMTLRGKDAAGR